MKKSTFRIVMLALISTMILVIPGCSMFRLDLTPGSTEGITATTSKTTEPVHTQSPVFTTSPPLKTTARATATPIPSHAPGLLDITALSKLDNTKLYWWIYLNDTHSPTAIDAGIRRIIEAHAGYYIGNTGVKKVYLTFDEGYENGYTAQILDDLKKNNVKAIFFITMPYLLDNPELVKRMVDEGHKVGNHSVSHLSFPDLTYEQIENEFKELDDKFFSIFNKKMEYFRPPMGEYSEMTLEAAKQFGYKTIFWSFAYADWDVNTQKGADYAYDIVMKNHHNGAIFLLHAVSSDNAGALDRIIKGLKDVGYVISPFDI